MEGSTHYEKDERPWGLYERFSLNEQSTVKIIRVKPGGTLSLQTHEHREEFWHIISGSASVTVGEKMNDAKTGDNFFIPKGSLHRISGGPDGCVFLEIAYGDFDEADIKRIEDKYGRA